MPIIGIIASGISGNLGLTVDYLVVAGGGGGSSAGGGAGGYRTSISGSPITLSNNTNYTINSWSWWRWWRNGRGRNFRQRFSF
jgi:hypothetical protein